MRKIIFSLLSLILALCFLINISQDLSATEIKFQKIEAQAKSMLQKTNVPHTEFDQITQELRKIKNEENNTIRQKTILLDEQKELLNALGVPEENNSIQETQEIKLKRQNIQQSISDIDADIKSSQLNIAQINDLLNSFAEKKQNALTAQILHYTPFLTNLDNLKSAISGGYDYLLKPHNPYNILLTCVFFIFIIISAFLLPRNIQQFLDDNHYNSEKKISARILLQIVISAFFILCMRFHIINLLDYPLFRASLQLIFGSILGLSLFELLNCIHFHISSTSITTHQVISFKNRTKNILRSVSLLTVPIGLLGYAELSSFISLNILSTITAVLFFLFTRRALVRISKVVNEKKNILLRHKDTELSPLAIIIFEPLLAFISLSIILFFWGVTSQDFAQWVNEYQNGFYIGDIFIDFNVIGTTFLLFIVIIAFTRLIQWFLEKRVFIHTKLDLGLQNTTITVTGYIGFIIAFLTASNALGLNMANLAIVAGALSVGIGFGLQTIFNNFVSGIILLFERPFKVGDWVTVGGNEGIVKKIKVRSTELETFSKISLIVPNSVMIGDTVQNFTLHDATGRVTIPIGVAYGSDTEKVKSLLLECAQKHDNITKFPEPHVLFNGFGDSSLDFELRCFLNNVMNRLSTASDLRFAIDKAFREHNIEIPFPQRDVHLYTHDK